MAYQEIIYGVQDGVATLGAQPARQTERLDADDGAGSLEALTSAEQDDNVRVIILTGAGRGFCAGADMGSLSSVASGDGGFAAVEARLREKFVGPKRTGAAIDFQKTYSYLLDIKKPILGAINGAAAGLGMVIALYCDIRFASDKAKFSTAFSRRGLIAEYGMSWMLPRIVGVANALDLLYSARLVDGRRGAADGAGEPRVSAGVVRERSAEVCRGTGQRRLAALDAGDQAASVRRAVAIAGRVDRRGQRRDAQGAGLRGLQRGRGSLPRETRHRPLQESEPRESQQPRARPSHRDSQSDVRRRAEHVRHRRRSADAGRYRHRHARGAGGDGRGTGGARPFDRRGAASGADAQARRPHRAGRATCAIAVAQRSMSTRTIGRAWPNSTRGTRTSFRWCVAAWQQFHTPEEKIEKLVGFLGHGKRFAKETPAEKLRDGDTLEVSRREAGGDSHARPHARLHLPALWQLSVQRRHGAADHFAQHRRRRNAPHRHGAAVSGFARSRGGLADRKS